MGPADGPHLGLDLEAGPRYGGTFQYALDVARALAPLADEGFRLTAFCGDPAWRDLLPPGFRVVERRRASVAGIPAALYRRIDRTCRGARRSGRIDPFVRAIDAAGCDLVLYPGQDPAAYQARSRALVAIHDLMHRYERRHAEYGGGEFEWRERHYRCICATAAGVLAESELGKRQLVESYGLDPGKIFVLPYAAPSYLARSAPVDVRAKYGLPERFLFYPAQFWEHKNHLPLVEALALVRSRGLDAKLVLCGAPKNAYPRVVRRIAELGLDEHVRILGYVPNEDMASLYREATATVFVSSIGPTNIPPLEAMAAGSPLVVSNVYAMPEQVGDAALLVDPKDPRDVAEKIERIWTDEGLRRTLAARGLARSARWTAEAFGGSLREIVRRLARPIG